MKKRFGENKILNNKFTNKAVNLINKYSIDKSIFKTKKIITERDVLDYLSNIKKDKIINKINKNFDQLIILRKEK